jgi:hypothetical protein
VGFLISLGLLNELRLDKLIGFCCKLERLPLVKNISAYLLYMDLPSIIRDSVATESLRIFAASVFSIRLGSEGPLDV